MIVPTILVVVNVENNTRHEGNTNNDVDSARHHDSASDSHSNDDANIKNKI